MYKFQTRSFGQVAVASLLSLGLTAGVVSAASATTHSNKVVSHTSTTHSTVAFQGIVTALPTGGVTVVNAKGASETYSVTSTTRLLRALNVKNAAIVAVNDRVEVRVLSSAPTVATSINILALNANKPVTFRGKVTALPAGGVTVINAKGTSETFTIALGTTKMFGVHAALALNDRVLVRTMTSAPLAATSINILGTSK